MELTGPDGGLVFRTRREHSDIQEWQIIGMLDTCSAIAREIGSTRVSPFPPNRKINVPMIARDTISTIPRGGRN